MTGSAASTAQDERDYQTYVSLFNNMSNFMKKPNIIVHLDVSPEESLRRIKLRGRDCESGITLEYLQVDSSHRVAHHPRRAQSGSC